MILILLLFFPVVLWSAGESDVSVVVKTDSSVGTRAWIKQGNWIDSGNIRFSALSALHGEKGVRLSAFPRVNSWLKCSLPMETESWLRFYARIDSSGTAEGNGSESPQEKGALHRFVFMNFDFTGPVVNEAALGFVFSMNKIPGQNSVYLSGRLFDNGWRMDSLECSVDLRSLYCIEVRSALIDSHLVLELFIDGVKSGQVKSVYYDKITSVDLKVFATPENIIPWVVSLDDFVFSRNRIGPIPEMPIGSMMDAPHDGIRYAFSPFNSHFPDENPRNVRWRVYDPAVPAFPIFDQIEKIRPYYNLVPFKIKNGRYYARACYKNNWGNWGDWSAISPFRVENKIDEKVKIMELTITVEKSEMPVSELSTGIWYDANLKVESAMSWDSLLYLILWLNDSSYTFGNISNKGGVFMPASSYVLNLSMANSNYLLGEKHDVNSGKTTFLQQDSAGLYCRPFPAGGVVDTSSGRIVVKFRLLSEAHTGPWQISACMVYKKSSIPSENEIVEAQTYTIRVFPNVIRKERTFSPNRLALLISLIIGLLGSIVYLASYVKRYKAQKKKGSAADYKDHFYAMKYESIAAFLGSKFRDKIEVKDVLIGINISRTDFYKAMATRNITLPQLMSKIKINEAKKLLIQEPDKSISEISLYVGMEPNWFFKVFKECEGITPKEYREKGGH